MRGLYLFELDAGRMGILSGLFIADEELVSRIAEEEFYAMGVLGKHSEVWGKVGDYTELILFDAGVIISLEDSLPKDMRDNSLDVTTISGFNPIYYLGNEDILYELRYGEKPPS